MSLADMPRIVEKAADYLEFFRSTGTTSVGFNVEEQEGHHHVAVDTDDALIVGAFWRELFAAWVEASCRPIIRDFVDVLHFAEASLAGERAVRPVDFLPTVTCDGDVVVLSPELAGYRDPGYDDFKAGNLYDESLHEILARAPSLGYVQDFEKGAAWCSERCPYFSYCRGGQASNRYFEHGDFLSSETQFCRNSRQLPFDVVIGVPSGALGAESNT